MKTILALVFTLLSLNVNASEYFKNLLKPNLTNQELSKQQKAFSRISKATFDYSKSALNEAESIAINKYTGSDYLTINRYLRNPSIYANYDKSAIDKLDHLIKSIDSGLKKLPVFKGTEVYRGSSIKTSVLDKLKQGDIIFDPAYMSTSFFPEKAKDFANNFFTNGLHEATLFEIHVKNRGHAIPLVSNLELEAEVLLPRNTYLKVVKIEISGQKAYCCGNHRLS